MQKSQTTKLPVWPVVKRLFQMAGGQRSWFYLALTLDLFQALILILGNHFTRRSFEAVAANDSQTFWFFVMITLGMSVLNIPLALLKVRGIGMFSERTLFKLRRSLAVSSTNLPIDVLEARHSGDMLSVLNADLGKLKSLLSNNLIELLGQSARCIAAFVYILSVNWILALVSTILTPLIFIAIATLTQPVSKRSEDMQVEIGQVNSIAQDGLSGVMVVKAFNLTGLMDERFHLANLKALKQGLGIARLRAIIDGITMPLAITPFILAIGLGGYFVIQQQVTFGALFAFINLLNFVVNPLFNIPNHMAAISEAAGAARRVFELSEHPAERTNGTVTRPIKEAAPAIAFDRLSFTYAGDETPVLKNISFEIPSGQTVAIVGPSGGGKSTLVKLILGFYSLPRGSLRLFGSDLNDWQLSAAREQMAFVAQDTYLFPVSIAENIRLGKPRASPAEVEQAAKLANIHDFIISLPDGYHTGAGEWGSHLSGGQRQRISLARAILKDAPILLLDEPTSALDTESEALVQQALERFTLGRTTLIIAHRLSTIKNADRVIVIQDGTIIEQGTHDELIARGGVYLDLYQNQFNLELPASPGSM